MFFYNLLIYGYAIIIRVAAIRKAKAKQWVNGRKDWQEKLGKNILALNTDKIIWMHCASYGEFEQGKPLMEAIKKKYPRYKLVLSFFSPSGYEAFRSNSGADLVCYLPLDTKKNAREFLSIVKPGLAIFVKYEFWLNFLFQLKAFAIPTFLVSAVFKPHHPFFRWYGGIFTRSLHTFNTLFIQDVNSGNLLDSIGIKNYEICGDTRFDRVLEIKQDFKPITFFEEFCANETILIAGSTWPDDEKLLISAFKKLNDAKLKLIIAPHNVDEKHLVGLQELLHKSNLEYLMYSHQTQSSSKQILIVDTIGILSKIYHYASIAYIGGGFDGGIHNCLEPSVYLKPVVFYGNDYEKFNEAVDLIQLKAATNVLTAEDLESAILNYLTNKSLLREIEGKLERYFEKNSGVTQKVLASIQLFE
jgi:3-deoxy-D-manno-octulosonic-acid transferase